MQLQAHVLCRSGGSTNTNYHHKHRHYTFYKTQFEPRSGPGHLCRYIATFFDDYSKFLVVRGITAKSVVPKVVKNVLQFLENQVRSKIGAVLTDWGSEYVNAELRSFFDAKGMHHQKAAPFTPEQNGAAERLNIMLMEKARAMLLDSELPPYLWLEAMATACSVRNRLPLSGLKKTPYEMFLKKKPDVSRLRVFGATAMH
jgi:transposase InsO family protein